GEEVQIIHVDEAIMSEIPVLPIGGALPVGRQRAQIGTVHYTVQICIAGNGGGELADHAIALGDEVQLVIDHGPANVSAAASGLTWKLIGNAIGVVHVGCGRLSGQTVGRAARRTVIGRSERLGIIVTPVIGFLNDVEYATRHKAVRVERAVV